MYNGYRPGFFASVLFLHRCEAGPLHFPTELNRDHNYLRTVGIHESHKITLNTDVMNYGKDEQPAEGIAWCAIQLSNFSMWDYGITCTVMKSHEKTKT